MFVPGHAFRREHCGLGRTFVRILVTSLRIASGPAVFLEVVQVKLPAFDNAADGIAFIIGPTDIVAFLANEDMVALGNDASGLLRLENLGETPARDGCHARCALFNAGDLEKSGCQVNEAHIVIHHPARIGDGFGPHDGQRKVVGVVVGITFAMRKRHAVVGGHNHERVFEQAALFQLGEHTPQMQVEVLHFQRVIEHVVAHLLGIRPAGGHAIDVGGLLAAFGDAGSVFVGAVRLMAAIPEGPRMTLGGGI